MMDFLIQVLKLLLLLSSLLLVLLLYEKIHQILYLLLAGITSTMVEGVNDQMFSFSYFVYKERIKFWLNLF